MENEDSINQKEKQIIKKFDALFKMHGLNSYDSFDNKVWFLKQNNLIQSYLSDQTSYSSNFNNKKQKPQIKLLEVLSKCNHTRPNREDLTEMNISVRQFIDRLSNTLTDIHSSIEISEENILRNDSLAKVAKISEIIRILNSKISGKSKIYFESKMITVLSSIANFPCSPYKAMLLLNSDDSSSNDHNESIQDLFPEEVFTMNTLIDVNQGNETIVLRNAKRMNKNCYAFQQYSFGILENDDKKLLVDKRMNGTTFSTFKLRLLGKNAVFESNVEYFLHLILTSIDDLCDLTKDAWVKSCLLKMKDSKKGEGREKMEEKSVGIEFIIELDDLTRIGILRRVKELISIPIETKTQCLMDIDEILTDFFPEIKDSVINILNRPEGNRSNCCAGCFVV